MEPRFSRADAPSGARLNVSRIVPLVAARIRRARQVRHAALEVAVADEHIHKIHATAKPSPVRRRRQLFFTVDALPTISGVSRVPRGQVRCRRPVARIPGVAICVAVPDLTGPDRMDEEDRFAVQDSSSAVVAESDGRTGRNCRSVGCECGSHPRSPEGLWSDWVTPVGSWCCSRSRAALARRCIAG